MLECRYFVVAYTWNFIWGPLNYLKCCKPRGLHETQRLKSWIIVVYVHHKGPWISDKVRESDFQRNDGCFWNSDYLGRNWQQKEDHVELLYVVTWLGAGGNHKFKWKLECITVIKKILRRIKEVWNFGGEIEMKTKEHQSSVWKKPGTQRRETLVLHWSSSSHFFSPFFHKDTEARWDCLQVSTRVQWLYSRPSISVGIWFQHPDVETKIRRCWNSL